MVMVCLVLWPRRWIIHDNSTTLSIETSHYSRCILSQITARSVPIVDRVWIILCLAFAEEISKTDYHSHKSNKHVGVCSGNYPFSHWGISTYVCLQIKYAPLTSTTVLLSTVAYDFHSPAFLIPLETSPTPFSTPLPTSAMPLPTLFPAPPVAPATVSPRPRPKAPTTPPTVFVRPPTVFPSVEVTALAPAVTPDSCVISIWLRYSYVMCGLFVV